MDVERAREGKREVENNKIQQNQKVKKKTELFECYSGLLYVECFSSLYAADECGQD